MDLSLRPNACPKVLSQIKFQSLKFVIAIAVLKSLDRADGVKNASRAPSPGRKTSAKPLPLIESILSGEPVSKPVSKDEIQKLADLLANGDVRTKDKEVKARLLASATSEENSEQMLMLAAIPGQQTYLLLDEDYGAVASLHRDLWPSAKPDVLIIHNLSTRYGYSQKTIVAAFNQMAQSINL